jgi:hypothetical protein
VMPTDPRELIAKVRGLDASHPAWPTLQLFADALEKALTLDEERNRLFSDMQSQRDKARAECERLREALEDMKRVRQVELDHVAQSAEEAFAEASARADSYERWAEEVAYELGCEREWSNLHDHFQCIREAAATDRSYRHSADATLDELRTECKRLREIVRDLLPPHSGACVTYEGWTTGVITPDSCCCNRAVKAGHAAIGKDGGT